MLKKTLMLAGVCLLLSVGSVFAGNAWSEPTKIVEIKNNESGNVFLKLESMINSANCSKADWVVMEKGNDNKKFIYSMLLTAFMNGTSVSYSVNGCAYNYAKLRDVKVTK